MSPRTCPGEFQGVHSALLPAGQYGTVCCGETDSDCVQRPERRVDHGLPEGQGCAEHLGQSSEAAVAHVTFWQEVSHLDLTHEQQHMLMKGGQILYTTHHLCNAARRRVRGLRRQTSLSLVQPHPSFLLALESPPNPLNRRHRELRTH
jgi:hypothetical protein